MRKNDKKIYSQIIKMIKREERILRCLNKVKQSLKDEDDPSVVERHIRKLISIYSESQNW